MPKLDTQGETRLLEKFNVGFFEKEYRIVNNETFRSTLSVGETVAVEFKRCGNGIENDTYESVC